MVLSLQALGIGYVDMGYWAMNLHVEPATFPAEQREQYKLNQARKLSQLGPNSVVLYKSHEYSSTLASLCDHGAAGGRVRLGGGAG